MTSDWQALSGIEGMKGVCMCVWPVPEWKTGSCLKSEKSITTDIREPISGCACVWHISPAQSTQDCTSKSVQFSTHQTVQHTYTPPENPPLQFSLLQRLSFPRQTPVQTAAASLETLIRFPGPLFLSPSIHISLAFFLCMLSVQWN